MSEFLANIDWTVLIVLAIVIGIVAFQRWVAPKLKNQERDPYLETIIVLDLVGAIYKDKDVKTLVNGIKKVVKELHEMQDEIIPENIRIVANGIIQQANLEIDENTLDIIVNTVLYYLA